MKKAVLLDRDGTLIRERHYLHDPEQVELERNVVPALSRLRDAGYLFIVITNQSGIGRGLYTLEDFRAVMARIRELLAPHDLAIEDVYHCPHHPKEAKGDYLRACDCRKPAPGMLEAAIREHDLDRAASFMVGDSLVDVGAGRAAGLTTILLRTGYGAEHEERLEEAPPDHVAEDLLDAAERCIP